MILRPLGLADAWVVEPERLGDERGFFARIGDRQIFADHGMVADAAQLNISYSAEAGTLRGMHWTVPPLQESKTIRAVRGRVLDVLVDLRPWSPTYLRHETVELSAENRLAVYLPPYFAHGHLTLTDDSELLYVMGDSYSPPHERGAPFDDPVFGIDWPHPPSTVSDKDRSWPAFDLERHAAEMAPAAPT